MPYPMVYAERSRFGTRQNGNGLCATCNMHQEVIVSLMAKYKVRDESNWEEEVRAHREKLEAHHPLCAPCQAVVKKVLSEQNRRIRARHMATMAESTKQKLVRAGNDESNGRGIVLRKLIAAIASRIIAALLAAMWHTKTFVVLCAHLFFACIHIVVLLGWATTASNVLDNGLLLWVMDVASLVDISMTRQQLRTMGALEFVSRCTGVLLFAGRSMLLVAGFNGQTTGKPQAHIVLLLLAIVCCWALLSPMISANGAAKARSKRWTKISSQQSEVEARPQDSDEPPQLHSLSLNDDAANALVADISHSFGRIWPSPSATPAPVSRDSSPPIVSPQPLHVKRSNKFQSPFDDQEVAHQLQLRQQQSRQQQQLLQVQSQVQPRNVFLPRSSGMTPPESPKPLIWPSKINGLAGMLPNGVEDDLANLSFNSPAVSTSNRATGQAAYDRPNQKKQQKPRGDGWWLVLACTALQVASFGCQLCLLFFLHDSLVCIALRDFSLILSFSLLVAENLARVFVHKQQTIYLLSLFAQLLTLVLRSVNVDWPLTALVFLSCSLLFVKF